MTPRRLALALAAGLALADASAVTLALPQLLADFHTTVQGVASIIGVYTVVLAVALLPAERVMRERGPREVGIVGFGLFAVASLLCGLSGSLTVLLAFRALQALGGAAGLVAAFALLTGEAGDTGTGGGAGAGGSVGGAGASDEGAGGSGGGASASDEGAGGSGGGASASDEGAGGNVGGAGSSAGPGGSGGGAGNSAGPGGSGGGAGASDEGDNAGPGAGDVDGAGAAPPASQRARRRAAAAAAFEAPGASPEVVARTTAGFPIAGRQESRSLSAQSPAVGHLPPARTLWLGVAVLSTAIGPALGGALTQAFAWQAIFLAQSPIALLAVAACWTALEPHVPGAPAPHGATAAPSAPPGATAAPSAPPGATAAPSAPPGATAAPSAPPHPTAAPPPAPRGTNTARPAPHARATAPSPTRSWPVALALALVSAALTAVLFLLVLLLVAGWGVAPLRAAATVTVLPLAALLGSRLPGPARTRAAAGCLLVGGGTIALAFLPDARLAWTIAPQALAGLGMGLALPALGGELLPERNANDAAWLLTMRHAGIAAALVLLAPITAHRLDHATEKARERGVALVLDAKLPPTDKLSLAPALLQSVDTQEPRRRLREAIADERDRYSAGSAERAEFDRLGKRADETLVAAVGDSFLAAFLITGALALLGGIVLLPGARRPALALAALLAGAAVAGGTAEARSRLEPAPVPIRDPCAARPLPASGGIFGVAQDFVIKQLDKTACTLGSSREEYVLALADPESAKAFEKKYGTDPRSTGGIVGALGSLLGG